ncbi:hypothetical protein BDL97_02G057000 [Sphagnum fallax]|nr:hypothetical protein BDL97_02G057000 [Sphagnum fallax]
MREEMSGAGDYVHFKAHVPLHRIQIGSNGTKHWRYYDFGPKSVPPLVCLSGIAGTADVFYKQILFLTAKVHLYGTSLGGFLAQLFAQYRPRRVKSLLLSNTFVDNWAFEATMPWASLISWTPEFVLKRYVLSGIQDAPQEPLIADSIDFVVNQLESLSREELASRLTLNTLPAAVGQITLPDAGVTIMDTNDYCAVPSVLKAKVSARYPGARGAFLKSGGDFPFLSRADEVNLHAQLHLRRVGIEGQPQLTLKKPTSKDRMSGSSSSEEIIEGDKDFKGKRVGTDTRWVGVKGQPQPTLKNPTFNNRSNISSSTEEIFEVGKDLQIKGVGSHTKWVGAEGQLHPTLKNPTFNARSKSSSGNEEILEGDDDFERKGAGGDPLQNLRSVHPSPGDNGFIPGVGLY